MLDALLLNVDDHEPSRYARHKILRSAGYRVIDACNGLETFRLVEQYRPDIVLLDIHLPDINGIEVCRQLKASAAGFSLIVIQISASAVTPGHTTTSLDAGADAYLAEPVDPEVLLATVNAMLRLHHAERSLAQAKRQLEDANKELRRSNEDLQQFAFAASHDLQEPLRAITTFTQLLERDLKDDFDERHREYIQHIVTGAGRMRNLIRDLLAYSQVGREDRPQEVIEIKNVIDWASANLQEQINDLDGSIEMASALPQVWGDFAHLGLVFQNLISNSLKYRKPGDRPAIRIETLPSSGREWIVSYSDNGVGIAPNFMEAVFAPFKRLHGPEIAGTGLGLALCRRIVEAHGGRIWIDSAAGEGTTFLIALPAILDGHPAT